MNIYNYNITEMTISNFTIKNTYIYNSRIINIQGSYSADDKPSINFEFDNLLILDSYLDYFSFI